MEASLWRSWNPNDTPKALWLFNIDHYDQIEFLNTDKEDGVSPCEPGGLLPQMVCFQGALIKLLI